MTAFSLDPLSVCTNNLNKHDLWLDSKAVMTKLLGWFSYSSCLSWGMKQIISWGSLKAWVLWLEDENDHYNVLTFAVYSPGRGRSSPALPHQCYIATNSSQLLKKGLVIFLKSVLLFSYVSCLQLTTEQAKHFCLVTFSFHANTWKCTNSLPLHQTLLFTW